MTLDDQELRTFLAGRAGRANGAGLRTRIVDRARATPQLAAVSPLRDLRAPTTRWPMAGSLVGAGFVALVVLIGIALSGAFRGVGQPSGQASASAGTGAGSTTLAVPAHANTGVCPLALLAGTLEGSPTDPWVVWVVGPNGQRVNVRWPAGYSAYFGPGLQLLNGDRVEVAAAGDPVRLGGATGDDGVWEACGQISAGPTDVPVTPPPYAAGTCPATPVTGLRDGTVPIVRESGLDWNFAGMPWTAGVGQKLVFPETTLADVIAADPISMGGGASRPSARYPAGSSPDFVFGIGLPSPDCWLLTEAGQGSASSIVVSAGPPPASPQSPASQNVPTETAPQTDLEPCPSTSVDTSGGDRTWTVGNDRWTDLAGPGTWTAGQERRLGVSGPIAADAQFRRVIASRLGTVSTGSDKRSAFVTEEPVSATPNGSGTATVDLTLPAPGCWAVAFVTESATSTIVVQPVAGS